MNNTENSGLSYELTGVEGGRIDGSTIYLNPNDDAAIFRVDGVLTGADDNSTYNLYVSTADECMEADFCKLHRESEEEGIKRFSFSIQRRYMAQSYIDFFAYDTKTGKTILLTRFEVAYDE